MLKIVEIKKLIKNAWNNTEKVILEIMQPKKINARNNKKKRKLEIMQKKLILEIK